MSRVNPDPHDEGYVYQPTQAITARFPAGVDDQAVERALIDAGFRPDQLMVFEGKEGRSSSTCRGSGTAAGSSSAAGWSGCSPTRRRSSTGPRRC